MENYYWIILIGVLFVVYALMIVRQKRQEKRSIEALNSFKVGDKVVTHIGIYGQIKRIYNTSFGKTCILEIGTDKKIDIEIDMRYIASLDQKVAVPDNNADVKENTKTENQNNKTQQAKKELEVDNTQTKDTIQENQDGEDVNERTKPYSRRKNNKKNGKS